MEKRAWHERQTQSNVMERLKTRMQKKKTRTDGRIVYKAKEEKKTHTRTDQIKIQQWLMDM